MMVRISYILFFVLALGQVGTVYAAKEAAFYVPEVRVDVTDMDSLRRGASTFFANCITCHSVKFMRYKRISDDLGLSEEYMRSVGMVPEEAKMTDPVLTKLSAEDAIAAYGIQPPDLSLKTRQLGTSWLHGFLMSYYQDPTSKTGFNNAFFEGTAMPNLLVGKQGIQEAVYETDEVGNKVLVGLAIKSQGSQSQKVFYEEMRDLVAFLDYVGEPAKIQRLNMGIYVIAFLLGLLLLTYLLKRELWRNVKK